MDSNKIIIIKAKYCCKRASYSFSPCGFLVLILWVSGKKIEQNMNVTWTIFKYFTCTTNFEYTDLDHWMPVQSNFSDWKAAGGQSALGRSPCQGGATTHMYSWSSMPARLHSAGHRVREEPWHTCTGGLPCWPDRTWQVAVSGRSHDTRAQVVFPACQTAHGRSPCQGGDATQIHMWPTLFARSHSLKYCKLTSLDAIFIQGTINHHNFILKGMVREQQ